MKDELPPETIICNDYRVIKTLGRGGFGITYKCEDIRLKHTVAIKEYFPDGMAERDPISLNIIPKASTENMFSWGRKKFLTEGTTLAAIQHKYSTEFIVKIIRFVEERQTAYLVMEFIDGMQIDVFASSNRITSAKQVEELFQSLCLNALKPIHDSSFYHRDIKPGNILIRQSNGQPVIIDFGAARQTAGGKSTVALLTPRYSAVEQYASQEDGEENEGLDLCGPFTDVYSLAATFYFIIKGKPPLDAPTRILADSDEKLVGDDSLSHYSDDFLQKIDWGMTPTPRDRPQTVDEWLSYKKSDSSAEHPEFNEETKVAEKYITENKGIGLIAALASVFVLVFIFFLANNSEDLPSSNTVARPKIEASKPSTIQETKVPDKKMDVSWVVGVDSATWTPIGIITKLAAIDATPDGTFQLKLHAEEPFRVKTQKGMAITRSQAHNFGDINGEVFLKSVNSKPQKVRVEIIQDD